MIKYQIRGTEDVCVVSESFVEHWCFFIKLVAQLETGARNVFESWILVPSVLLAILTS